MEKDKDIDSKDEQEEELLWTTEEVEIAINFVKKPLYSIIKLLLFGYVVILVELVLTLALTFL